MKFAIKTPAAAFAKKALKTLSMTAMIAGAVSLAACSDSDDDGNEDIGLGGSNGSTAIRTLTVKASSIQGLPSNVAISEVKAVTYPSNVVVATTIWNDGFELKLPETVSPAVLNTPQYEFETDQITASSNAKICRIDFEVYNAAGEYDRDLSFGKVVSSTEWVEGYYLYSDADCNITGTELYSDEDDEHDYGRCTYNLSLKKGWNRVYFIEKEIGDDFYDDQYTTKEPSGLGWFWSYFGSSR